MRASITIQIVAERRRLFEGIEIATLHVFSERQFRHLTIFDFDDDSGDFVPLCLLGCSKSAFASDDFVVVVALSQNDRLEHSVLLETFCKFL